MNNAENPAWDLIVIGGGAAGYFGAITAAEQHPGLRILILERGKEVLQKVRISGGGRCNVTHACFDPSTLTSYYPRGARELLSPFMRFGPIETVQWYKNRGVILKTETDGRMFPVTDNSGTIISCLESAAVKANIHIQRHSRVEGLLPPGAHQEDWAVRVQGNLLTTKRILLASGSSTGMWNILSQLGLKIIEPVPSLFTFNIKDSRIQGLAGVAVPAASIVVEGQRSLAAQGPLLITHWGLSGPAILKLSAWGARALAEQSYKIDIKVSWHPLAQDAWAVQFKRWREEMPRKAVINTPGVPIPFRLWERLCKASGMPEDRRWAETRKEELDALQEQCTACLFSVKGKSTFKEEFVTAGGVDLREINFKTLEARRFPGLYLAGEVLNIDALTGGFNFQAAWTGGWIAGNAIAVSLST